MLLKRLQIILVFWLLVLVSNDCLAGLPVLPLPRFYSVSDHRLTYPSDLLFSSSTAGDPTLQRLLLRWKEFKPEFPPQSKTKPGSCRLMLLGKNAADDALVEKYFRLHRDSIGQEGYLLIVQQGVRFIAANSETGLFYGLQTLRQLTRAGYSTSIQIADWPAFQYRVIFDDISRGPIPTVATIKKQIQRLAEIKINYLSFYIEHVIQTVSHPGIAPPDGKLTIAEVKELSVFAARYHMQLIGGFQSFGHFEKILALPAYKEMGATASLIDPDNPKAKQFLEDVIGEMCDAFSAPWFNVNCDETFDLGKGRSKAGVDSLGIAAYYAEHIRFLNSIVQKHNKKLMLWGDIAIQHEAILDMLPRDLTWLNWEYGTPASFDKWIQPFSKRGLNFMVCPGILNSNRLFPDHEMAVKNIAGFAKAGKENNAPGVFTTVWDDGGASLFAGDWYSVYKAAETSWNLDPANNNDFDNRYCNAAYGDAQSKYTDALHTFLQLRKLPLTWNMTDQFWNQSILPMTGRALLLNNTDAAKALAILAKAGEQLPASPVRHAEDLTALQIAMRQYVLTLRLRDGLPALKEAIEKLRSMRVADRKRWLTGLELKQWLADQQELISLLRDMFRDAWLTENQPYWLNIALRPFDEKQKDLAYLQQEYDRLSALITKQEPVPDNLAARLQVFQSNNNYFQNWLLCGPLKSSNEHPPAFLYFPDSLVVAFPKPGDQFEWENRSIRWKKFASPTGGISYFADAWPGTFTDNDWVYAYASVQSDSARNLPAALRSSQAAQVFCNGQLINKELAIEKEFPALSGSEFHMQLPLIKGINYLVIKLPGNSPDKSFAFRLPASVTVSNHKYKYYLNPNISDHDAE